MAVRVVTDSACDLPPEMCEELGIEVVPLTIRFGDREYVDRKELTHRRVLAPARVVVGAPRDRGAVGRRVRGDVPRACTTTAPTASCASTCRRTSRRRCSRRRSRPKRSTDCARSRSSTPRPRRWASASSRCTRRGARAEGADVDDDRARGQRAPRSPDAVRGARHARVPPQGRPHRRRAGDARFDAVDQADHHRRSTARSSRRARCAPARRRCASCSTGSPKATSSRSA